MLHEGKLAYKIPFPMAWDNIEKFEANIDDFVDKLIKMDISNFHNLPDSPIYTITEQFKNYIKNKRFTSKSFDTYCLQGIHSTLFIDKNGFFNSYRLHIMFSFSFLISYEIWLKIFPQHEVKRE